MSRDDKISAVKLATVQYGVLLMFVVLALRLWDLQVVSGDKYEVLAERNRVRAVPILAPRGKILDREGRIIVDNRPSSSVLLLRDQQRDWSQELPKIAAGLNLTVPEIQDKLRRFAAEPKFRPMDLKDDITADELAFVESHRDELPELEVIMEQRRLYPRNGFMAHIIGYVGEVSEQMLNSPAYELYEQGDVVGKSGVEQQYNDILIGKDGERRTVVNSHGKELAQLDSTPPKPGQPLRLTVDLDIQIAAEEALEGHNGAIVALDPHNGEILAMASRPTYDPNLFAVRITRKEWSALLTDPAKPLLNKAIQAQLAPGSVFKIIMATAGLQEGVAEDMHVNCPGGATFYGRFFKCWIASKPQRAHGLVDIRKAIYQSCDVFFYTLAERLGIGRIAKYAYALGLGQKTGVDLPDEVSGVMPSEEWKIKNFKQKWYAGETISVGIGQGAVATTPIQLARALGGIAMGGELHRPHVVFGGELPPQYREASTKFPGEIRVPIDPKNWETITDAMSEVVNPIGTAPSAHLKDIDFAGKTGSAQVVSNDLKKKLGKSAAAESQFKDNGWFVGFTPRRNPDIVVAVLVEQGEHGSLAAGLAAQVIKAYVEKQRKIPTKIASAPATARAHSPAKSPIEMAAMWSNSIPVEHPDADAEPAGEHLHVGRFVIR